MIHIVASQISIGSMCFCSLIKIFFLHRSSCKRVMKRAKVDQGNVIAIRTKTQLEILDDGFKWRKYGKKKVKSNPNPR